jgi:hypothetical protein
MSNATHKPTHLAYTVRKTDKGNFYTRIGAVFAHGKGGGFSIQLSALPLDGNIVCFPPKEKPEGEEEPKVD